jgi:RNA polymerase sigma factor (sigma-70 family)
MPADQPETRPRRREPNPFSPHLHRGDYQAKFGHLTDGELARSAQAGDTQSRNALIMRHFGFIHLLVRRQCRGCKSAIDAEELIGEGVHGMARAIATFDESKGFKLTTYAHLPITQRVRRAINQHDAVLKRPDNMPKGKQRDAWLQATTPAIDVHDPALGLSLRDDGALSRLDLEEQRLISRWAMDQLEERERNVIVMRMVDGLTLAEAGAVLGLCRERVRQIERDAIARMRELVAA